MQLYFSNWPCFIHPHPKENKRPNFLTFIAFVHQTINLFLNMQNSLQPTKSFLKGTLEFAEISWPKQVFTFIVFS